MAKFIKIEGATVVQAVTSTGSFLTAKINNVNIGMPMFTFTDPSIELLPATPSFNLQNSTIYTNATSYGVAISLSINNSALCVPLFKLPVQNPDAIFNLEFNTPTLVGNITSTGTYMIIANEKVNYGIPLYQYGSLYDTSNNTLVITPTIDSTTVISVGKPTLDITDDSGSTYLNPKIEAYSDVINRIKRLLGWPSINLDLCDENISDYIDAAIELYSKYGGYTEEFLVFNTSIYKKGAGIKLDNIFSYSSEGRSTGFQGASAMYDYDLKDYRKVIDCWSFEQGEGTGVNTLFTLEQAMAQQTYFSYMLGSAGFDLVTWDIMKGWLETRTKVLAQTPYFRFNPKTQQFTILPEPYEGQVYYGVIGCYVESTIRHLITEPWIYFYALALTKIAIGQIRGKFGGMVMFGGGTLNANDAMTQGLAEKTELEKQLLSGYGFVDTGPCRFFLG